MTDDLLFPELGRPKAPRARRADRTCCADLGRLDDHTGDLRAALAVAHTLAHSPVPFTVRTVADAAQVPLTVAGPGPRDRRRLALVPPRRAGPAHRPARRIAPQAQAPEHPMSDDPFVQYSYERPATGAQRDAWLENYEQPDTHVVTYQPTFRIRVALPPWVDPDAWLAEASQGWNGELCDTGEAWTEPAGYAHLHIESLGSTQTIDDTPGGPA